MASTLTLSEYNHSVSIHDLFISINLWIVPFLYPGCFRGGFVNGLIPEFFPACECLPASFILEWRFAWVSYSWVMLSCPQRKLPMHFSTVLGHWLSLWEAGGQPDISSSCKHFVSSAQMPEQSLSWSQHLNKDTSWWWEFHIKISWNTTCYFYPQIRFILYVRELSCTIWNPSSIPFVGFQYVRNTCSSCSHLCLPQVRASPKLLSSVFTGRITSLSFMTVTPFSSIHFVPYDFSFIH